MSDEQEPGPEDDGWPLAPDMPDEYLIPRKRPSEPQKPPSSPEEAEQRVLDATYALSAHLDVIFRCEHERDTARETFTVAYAEAYERTQRQGNPAHLCKPRAELATTTERKAMHRAMTLLAHAERVRRWRETDLFAAQSISNSIRSTFGPMSSGIGGR